MTQPADTDPNNDNDNGDTGTDPASEQRRLTRILSIATKANTRLTQLQNTWIPPGPSNTPAFTTLLSQISSVANSIISSANALTKTLPPPT
jgi:hypothetical protein